jgi:hypothetical protein
VLGISEVDFLDEFMLYNIFVIGGISEILPRFIVLDVEDSSENLELVEFLWKDSLTLPSLY